MSLFCSRSRVARYHLRASLATFTQLEQVFSGMQSKSFLFKMPASISRTLKSCLDLGLLLIPSSALLPAYRSLQGELLPMHLITLYQPC